MRFARIELRSDRTAPRAAVVDGETATLLPTAGAEPLLAALRDRPDDLVDDSLPRVALDDVRLLAPIRRPGKIIAVGLNYADHTAESGLAAPPEPLTFAKYPTAVADPGQPIEVPTDVTTQVDWEAELAVVVGRTCGPLERGSLAHVAGYTVGNDVSARDLQFRDQQWTRAKSIDTFCPLGPVLVTLDELHDPQALRIWAAVNGVVMQDASTADMIFGVADLLDFVTATVTLEPGDVVLTGTPPGVGAFRDPPVFLADGDVVIVGVEGIGELTNPVRYVRERIRHD